MWLLAFFQIWDAVVTWNNTVLHESDLVAEDAQGHVFHGIPAPPGKPPRLYRPVLEPTEIEALTQKFSIKQLIWKMSQQVDKHSSQAQVAQTGPSSKLTWLKKAADWSGIGRERVNIHKLYSHFISLHEHRWTRIQPLRKVHGEMAFLCHLEDSTKKWG